MQGTGFHSRPVRASQLGATQHVLSLLALRCFVAASAGLRLPATFCSVTVPSLIRSWIQSWPTARCRTRPIPLRLQMPMAAAESIRRERPARIPRSVAMAWVPRPSLAPCTAPPSSASAEESVRTFWVRL